MSRVKISEYRAKKIIYSAFNKRYGGLEVDLSKELVDQLGALDSSKKFVVKLDQAVKKRNKLGLVFVNRKPTEVPADLNKLKKMGYSWALVEHYVEHVPEDEKFLAIVRAKEGIEVVFSSAGGVNVEKNREQLIKCTFDHFDYNRKNNLTSLNDEVLAKIYKIFIDNHMTYLELNPLLVVGKDLLPLDAAIEVDSAAMLYVDDNWQKNDIRNSQKQSKEEKAVSELSESSPASFSLRILNQRGSIFLLLSGGGASVVVADEIASRGLHDEIVNYGEYSGNPNEEETYIYTKSILSLIFKSTSKNKVLIIGGGTANFTDVSKTFDGILKAFREAEGIIREQNLAVFIRRGGPNYQQALKKMKNLLDDLGLKNDVCGPETSIAQIIEKALKEVRNV